MERREMRATLFSPPPGPGWITGVEWTEVGIAVYEHSPDIEQSYPQPLKLPQSSG
jgi:hypothetical protein